MVDQSHERLRFLERGDLDRGERRVPWKHDDAWSRRDIGSSDRLRRRPHEGDRALDRAIKASAEMRVGAMRAIISIDSFFSEIGRGYGWSRPSRGRIIATSSDSKRQPRATSAAHRVLLPTPEGPGMTSAAPSRSRTAACTSRKRAVDVHTSQFSPDSSIGRPMRAAAA
jgi:hypothetical protein